MNADTSRTDRFPTLLDQRLDRRAAILAAVAGLGTVGLAASVSPAIAQDATPVDPLAQDGDYPTFLFVQLADAGTWLPKPDEDGVYLLTLAGTGEQTLYFSDRPERIVGTVPTGQFLENLGFTPANPPNAAIVVEDSNGTRDVLVVELMNPVYVQDSAGLGDDSIVYEARVLENYQGNGLEEWDQQQTDDTLAEGFTNVSLFIDDCPAAYNCYYSASFFDPIVNVGPIPGGPVGTCWDGSSLNCLPCGRTGYSVFDYACNQAYADCHGQCFTYCLSSAMCWH
jgi:hypothetical protein